MNDLIEQQFSALRDKYPSAGLQRRPDGSALVTIPDFRLVEGWDRGVTTVTFIVPVGYPFARPDSFWTEADLKLSNGGTPANTGQNANHGGDIPLLWFSFHAGTWDPNLDSLFTYAKVIRRRLSSAQ